MRISNLGNMGWIPLLTISTLAASPAVNSVELIGKISAQHPVNVVAEVSGVIETAKWQTGDKLTKGKPLATIKSQDFKLATRRQQANVALVSADLKIKKSIYSRYQELRIKNSLSQHELEVAKANFEAAKANLALAKIDLEKALLDLNNTQLYASFDGYIISRSTENGAWVNRGDLLYQLVNIDRVNVRLLASEFDLQNLTVGQSIQIWPESAPNHKITATINRIGVSLDSHTLAYPIEVDIDNSGHTFKPGMSIHATTQFQPQ